MAKFLATNGLSYLVGGVLMDAKEELTLITPVFKLSKDLRQHLEAACERGTEIRIVFAKKEMNKTDVKKFSTYPNLNFYEVPGLNTRCYYNEKIMVLGSVELHSFSEKSNRDMGVLLERDNDPILYKQAVLEVASILNSGSKVSLQAPVPVGV